VVAKELGRSEEEANIAYGSMDIGLSVHALSRHVLKPDSWKLFRHVEADYVRSYKTMGAGALSLEVFTDLKTVEQIYQEKEK